MALRKAPDHAPRLDTVYDGRFPVLSDMLRQGGKPGVTYYLCNSAFIAGCQAQGLDMVKDMPALEIRGPRGVASAFLMCAGDPIPGADPLNGVRLYFIDPSLHEATGLGLENSNAQTLEGQGTREDAKGDARIQGGDAQKLVRQEGDEQAAGGRNRDVRAARVREEAPPEHA